MFQDSDSEKHEWANDEVLTLQEFVLRMIITFTVPHVLRILLIAVFGDET